MSSIILVLLRHDLAYAFKNKTFYLILFIPLFVFASLKLADQGLAGDNRVNIGLVRDLAYAPAIIQSITDADTLVALTWISTEAEGRDLLLQRKLHGVLVLNQATPGSLALLVLSRQSLQTSTILQNFSTLQNSAEGGRGNWISTVDSLRQGNAQRELLPVWVLMLILLTGFIILPMQVAEEKEKKLLLALLQTPIHEYQWLLAKLLLGIILGLTAILVLHLLGQFGPVQYPDYIPIILAGSYCFSAFGIFLGFLCRSQASARTLGVVFFLPLLLPSAMSDVSGKLTTLAPWLPSWQLFRPLQAILLEDGRIAGMTFDWIYLLLLGSILLFLAFLLMKKRWLM